MDVERSCPAPRPGASLLLAGASFVLWAVAMRGLGEPSLFAHNTKDLYTRQARAWLQGRAYLEEGAAHLEVARHGGRLYNSFPPVPSLFELPLVLVFRRQTPNSLLLYGFLLTALLAMQRLALSRGFTPVDAWAVAMAFVFTTNVWVSASVAHVWGMALGTGFALALAGAAVLRCARGAAAAAGGYALLGLAVGCRPLLLALLPLFLATDPRTAAGQPRRAAASAAAGLLPVLLAMAAYNALRFGNPLEVGHSHLDFGRELPHGLFSLAYVPRNAWHGLLRLPEWSADWPWLRFDANGTALWLNNAILPISVYGLVRRPMPARVRLAAALALLAAAAAMFSYGSTGWRQFGYRYAIDLLPAAFIAFVHAFRRVEGWMVPPLAASFAVNAYGIAAWSDLPA